MSIYTISLSAQGRHQFSTSPASKNLDGSFQDLHSFGARSWSVRRADDMSLVYDSGDDIATWTLSQIYDIFNSEMDSIQAAPFDEFDARSDNKVGGIEQMVNIENPFSVGLLIKWTF